VSCLGKDHELSEKAVALTFDDGPAEWTSPILDILHKAEVVATFFVIGQEIGGREAILERTAAEGHEIGNHTQTHQALNLTADEIEREIVLASDEIRSVLGVPPKLFRAPGFGVGGDVCLVAGKCGFTWAINASATTADYDMDDPDEIANNILSQVRPGGIIDLHDGKPSNEPPPGDPQRTREDRWPTVEAVRRIVPRLNACGYRFVTVSELLAL